MPYNLNIIQDHIHRLIRHPIQSKTNTGLHIPPQPVIPYSLTHTPIQPRHAIQSKNNTGSHTPPAGSSSYTHLPSSIRTTYLMEKCLMKSSALCDTLKLLVLCNYLQCRQSAKILRSNRHQQHITGPTCVLCPLL